MTPLRLSIPMLSLVLLFATACDKKTRLQILALAVESASQEFSEQKLETANALSSADQARQEAVQEIQFTFSSPKTQRFIERWKDAEREVQQLRADFNEVLEKADFFFAYAEKKKETIRDSSLRSRSAERIAKKKEKFAVAATRTHAAIKELEGAVQEGNDFIAALEIAGVLGSVSGEIESLNAIQDRAVEKLPEMEALIDEGRGLVELEFSALEKQEQEEQKEP